ncbi:MAG TPA: AAA family ATPase, partial [Polyangiaceae bacterium]|nr:AAA family ATPase [Polyangiaceae bacterium]
MRFLRLEVSHFRAVDHAVVDFGPGLNVLFGPNDLGKTTLAAALRAVLLLPAESTAHQQFLPWHSTELPQVCLSFARGEQLWRITKTFGSSAATATLLESSLEAAAEHAAAPAVVFREEARGRAADRRVRELLRWGIEAPGGKGGGRGLPESFLSHVLLGAQGSVAEILGRTLGMDRDASGRQQLHEMLQALAQDPVFQRVLRAAQEKADSAFTPTGRRKAGQSSPFAPIRQNIVELSQELERVAHQKRESDEVTRRIQLASDRRLALEAEIESASARVAEQEQLQTRAAAQRSVREQAETARRELEVERAAEQELARLRTELEAARHAAEQSARSAAAQRRAHAELQAELERAEARLRELGSAENRERER